MCVVYVSDSKKETRNARNEKLEMSLGLMSCLDSLPSCCVCVCVTNDRDTKNKQ